MHGVHAAETHAARRTTEGLARRAHRSVFVHARAEIDWAAPRQRHGRAREGRKRKRLTRWPPGVGVVTLSWATQKNLLVGRIVSKAQVGIPFSFLLYFLFLFCF
jgi:hypothetical protein